MASFCCKPAAVCSPENSGPNQSSVCRAVKEKHCREGARPFSARPCLKGLTGLPVRKVQSPEAEEQKWRRIVVRKAA